MRDKQRNKRGSFWLSTITAFLLSVFITMAGYLGCVYFGFLNNSLILDSISKTSYYSGVVDYTTENAQAMAIPMGLAPEVFNNVFSLNETYMEGEKLTKAELQGETYTPDVSDVKERLTANIGSYLAQQNITATAEQQANITSFVNTIAEDYSANLSVPSIKYFVSLKDMFTKMIYIGILVFIVLGAFAVFLLFKLHSRRTSTYRDIAYSTLGAALMTAILPIYVLVSGIYKKINITSQYFYNFVTDYITNSLLLFIYLAIVLFIVSLLFIILAHGRKTKKKVVRRAQ